MDYQPMNQPMNQPEGPQGANTLWYVIGVAAVIVLGLWYYYGNKAPTTTETSAIEQATMPALGEGNTTTDISADLNQVPDTSAALDADAAASASAIQGL